MAEKDNVAQVELVPGDAGSVARLALSGELNFQSVASVLEQVEHHIDSLAQQNQQQKNGQSLTIDLTNVTRCNSAALALLVECKAIARRRSSALQFSNVPAGVLQLAEVCEAQPLLQ